MPDASSTHTLHVQGVSKRFGSTLAVDDVSILVKRGELIGIAGHNGAGKSTILKIINGTLPGDSGTVSVSGLSRSARTTVAHPEELGVRTVYQELSLCASLRVDETAAIFDHSARGLGWRTTAWRNLEAVLDEMFPDHGIRRDAKVGDLSIARRQMIECASTMVDSTHPPALVILDEPTSSLDTSATSSFYAYLRKKADSGLSAIVTTHRLHEMIDNLTRIYVMRDGSVMSEHDALDATKDFLVNAMGLPAHETDRQTPSPSTQSAAPATAGGREVAGNSSDFVVRLDQPTADGDSETFDIAAGEIIGFAGLEGHGQLTALELVYRAASRKAGREGRPRKGTHHGIAVRGNAAYVSGDRGVRGIFPIWDVAANISFSTLGQLTTGGFIRRDSEERLVTEWFAALGIKGSPTDPITSLSGGTQQKALMARAMAVGSDVLLLEDPTRGVDQATKSEIYGLLRAQAQEGQTVIWYSTENEELRNCHRVFVFRSGKIVATIPGADASEDAIIALSFGDRASARGPEEATA